MPTPVRVWGRAMLLGVGCSRDDVAGIPLTDVLPQKRRARAPGADIRGVGLFAVSGLPDFSTQSSRHLC